MTTANSTLDRIQREIKEIKEREEELRNKYEQIYNSNNNNYKLTNNNVEKLEEDVFYEDKASSSPSSLSSSSSTSIPASKLVSNGTTNRTAPAGRLFTPNSVVSTKGMMQKFLKSRGRINSTSVLLNNKKSDNNNFVYEFQPAKVTAEIGKSPRNGFISAEEKMRRELQEYQLREQELRRERRKSQPDLMAALEAEDEDNTNVFSPEKPSNLKSAKSLVSLYKNNEDSEDDEEPIPKSNLSNGGSNLKASRSLAALCDISDEELDTPGTYSLIMQFEKLKSQQDRS